MTETLTDVLINAYGHRSEPPESLKKLIEDKWGYTPPAVPVKPEEPRIDGLWEPEEGDVYWFQNSSGSVFNNCYTDYEDKERLSLGNVYPTLQAAKDAVKRQQILVKLRRFANGWEPDWNDESQEKWHISYSYVDKIWAPNLHFTLNRIGIIYFKTESEVRDAIKIMGDEIKFLLGVES